MTQEYLLQMFRGHGCTWRRVSAEGELEAAADKRAQAQTIDKLGEPRARAPGPPELASTF
jgi:hypothetical protein